MAEECLSYIVIVIFCTALSTNLLVKLKSRSSTNRDIRQLRDIIFDYLVLLVTDAVSELLCYEFPTAPHILMGLSEALAVSAAVFGCFLWYEFINARLYPENARTGLQKLVIYTPVAVMCMLDMMSAFTGWVFYIDDQSVYQLGGLFWLQCAVSYLYLLMATVEMIIGIMKAVSAEKRMEYVTYFIYIIVSCLIELLEDKMTNLPILEIAIYLVIQNTFLNLYKERERDYARKERELSESRMSTMLSQIQPHFIYNVLAVIQDLCHGKAPEAEQATIEFARYLRGNLDSLSSKTVIPFENELGHTMNYLALERRRFGDDILRVQYDIRVKDFSLPALSLQPLTENAVHYGVMKRDTGGNITISACVENDRYVVRVTDDGQGFDPAELKQDGRTHVGIDNVRKRIEEMCKGTLTITSRPGEGTVAEISIPMT